MFTKLMEPGLRSIFMAQNAVIIDRISRERERCTNRIRCEYCGSSPMSDEYVNGTCPNCGGPIHG